MRKLTFWEVVLVVVPGGVLGCLGALILGIYLYSTLPPNTHRPPDWMIFTMNAPYVIGVGLTWLLAVGGKRSQKANL